MSCSTPSSPDLSLCHRIRRKPPPPLDVSERYPSPDPLDPFAPLWVLRNRTSSRLSTQDVLATRTSTTSYVYSTSTAQVSVNTSISPIHTPSPKAKIGHHRPYPQTTFIDPPQMIPLISSPLVSQPDLLYRQQPFPHRHTNVGSPRKSCDMNDSSETESDTSSVPLKADFNQSRRTASPNYRFLRFLLLRKASFLGSGKTATGIRSSMIELKQIQKSDISPPVVSTVPNPVISRSINGQSVSKFTTSLSADLPHSGSVSLTSDEKIHHQYQHDKRRHPMTSDTRKDLKQDFQRPPKLPSLPISPRMLRKRMSNRPFSSNIALSTRSTSSSSYVHISTPTPVPFFSQPTSEDAYTSPRKAPVPPVSPTAQEKAPKDFSDQFFGDNFTQSTSSEWDLPSLLQLNYAAGLPITGDDGKHITFGSLFESQSTIVIFIRHFWCPLCQDYMSSVQPFIRPEMVCNACESGDHHHHQSQSQNQHHNGIIDGGGEHVPGTRVRFVVISNGAPGMIAKYRQIFGLPFKVYTDPTLALYQALGMGRDGDIKHNSHQSHKHSTSDGGGSSNVISEKNSDINKHGGYVKHSLMGGIAMVVMRALKVCMPVWEKGGDISQLGGEFIFGPGLTCTYAHRMQTTKGHAPIQDVLQAAGISAPNHTFSPAEGRHVQPQRTQTGKWSTCSTSKKCLRRRHESMNTLRDNETNQVNLVKRVSRRYSINVMSREEEDRWMELRQNSIERLQEKKDMRRGMSRVGSSQSGFSRQHRQFLEMMGEVGDDNNDHGEKCGPIMCVTEDSEQDERPSPTPTPTPETAPVDDIS